MIKVSIIILDFNKGTRVLENVEGIANQNVNFDIEVIVVDNSCDPENAARLKKLEEYGGVKVIVNEKNIGYIRGNNKGAKAARGQYLMIVNPDILWPNADTLQKMVDFMDHFPRVGVLGPKQINDRSGKIAMTVRAFPQFPVQVARRTFLRNVPGIRQWVHYDEMRHLNHAETQTVDWLQSSCWLVRKDLWDKFGGLNEDYFIFMSDPDFCFRAWETGFEVVYFPETHVLADGRRCSAGGVTDFFKKWTLRQHTKEAARYSLKHLFSGNPHHRYLDVMEKQADVQA